MSTISGSDLKHFIIQRIDQIKKMLEDNKDVSVIIDEEIKFKQKLLEIENELKIFEQAISSRYYEIVSSELPLEFKRYFNTIKARYESEKEKINQTGKTTRSFIELEQALKTLGELEQKFDTTSIIGQSPTKDVMDKYKEYEELRKIVFSILEEVPELDIREDSDLDMEEEHILKVIEILTKILEKTKLIDIKDNDFIQNDVVGVMESDLELQDSRAEFEKIQSEHAFVSKLIAYIDEILDLEDKVNSIEKSRYRSTELCNKLTALDNEILRLDRNAKNGIFFLRSYNHRKSVRTGNLKQKVLDDIKKISAPEGYSLTQYRTDIYDKFYEKHKEFIDNIQNNFDVISDRLIGIFHNYYNPLYFPGDNSFTHKIHLFHYILRTDSYEYIMSDSHHKELLNDLKQYNERLFKKLMEEREETLTNEENLKSYEPLMEQLLQRIIYFRDNTLDEMPNIFRKVELIDELSTALTTEEELESARGFITETLDQKTGLVLQKK